MFGRYTNNRSCFLLIVAAAMLFLLSVVRLPVPDGQFRAMFRLVAEAGVLFAVAGLIAYRVNFWAGAVMALVVASWAFQIHHGRVSLVFRDYWLFIIAWFVFVAMEARMDGRISKWLMHIIAVVTLLNVGFLCVQWCGSKWAGMIQCAGMVHPTGLMANKNETCALIAMALPAFLRAGWKKLLPAWALGLVLSQSTAPALAAGIGSVVWGLATDRLWVLPCAVVGFIGYVLWDPGVYEAWQARVDIWSLGWEKFWLHPFFGAGIGHWHIATKQLHAHNDFWQLTFDMGLLFPVFAIGYAVSVVRGYTKKTILPIIGVIIAAICSMFSFTGHVATTAVFAATWMGLANAQRGGVVE